MKKISILFIIMGLLITRSVYAFETISNNYMGISGNITETRETPLDNYKLELATDNYKYCEIVVKDLNNPTRYQYRGYNFCVELPNEDKQCYFQLKSNGVVKAKVFISYLCENGYIEYVIANKKLIMFADEEQNKIYVGAVLLNKEDSINATYKTCGKRLYVSGCLKNSRLKNVTIGLKNKNDGLINYISQVKTDAEGKFNIDFKFSGDISQNKLYLNTDSVYYTGVPITIDNKSITPDAGITFTTCNEQLEVGFNPNIAFTGNNDTAYVICAIYGRDNKLLDCRLSNNYDKKIFADIPKDALFVKVFILESIESLTPLTDVWYMDLSN